MHINDIEQEDFYRNCKFQATRGRGYDAMVDPNLVTYLAGVDSPLKPKL